MIINFPPSAAFFRWRPRAWLRVTGEDAGVFLQGQFSNDLRALARAEVRAVYGLWLTAKGRVLADGFVLRGAVVNEYWIGSYQAAAATILERLEHHVVADDVVFEDATSDWAGVTLMAMGVAQLAAELEPAFGFIFPGRRGREESLECIYRVGGGEPAVVVGWSGPWLTAAEMTRRRIVAGIPAIPEDIGPADLPHEGGLDGHAISFSKGCYVGQEVMARLKSKGQVRRRLVRVRGSGNVSPVTPVPVYCGGRQVGELRSAAGDGAEGWIGLAMVSRLHVGAGAELAFGADLEPTIHLLDAP